MDRLGDAKQPVRQAAGLALAALLRVLSAPLVLERLAKAGACEHKSWRVREGVLLALAGHVQAGRMADLTPREQEQLLLPLVAARLQDGQAEVRHAATECLAAMHALLGEALVHLLSAHAVRPAQMKDLYARFDSSAAAGETANSECAALSLLAATCKQSRAAAERDCSGDRRNRAPPVQRARSALGAQGRKSAAPARAAADDADDDAVVPVFVTRESELLAEVAEVVRGLDLKNDWDVRNRAMKRLTVRASPRPSTHACAGLSYAAPRGTPSAPPSTPRPLARA